MRSLPLLPLLLLAACSSANLRGRVVDDLGQPMAGARISIGGFPTPAELDENILFETDENGEFDGPVMFRSRSGAPVRAMAPDGRSGGVGHVNRRREPVTIVMRPLSAVKGLVRFDKLSGPVREWLDKPRDGTGYRPRVLIGRPRVVERLKGPETVYDYVATGTLDYGRFEFLLGPGTYRVQIGGVYQPMFREFTVPATGEAVDLGEFEALPDPKTALFGEPAPALHLVDARGIPRDFQWSSMRGKTVLLYFWDHRMARHESWMPALLECYRAYPDRDRFEIIAIHNNDDVATVEDLGAEFPFPVAIDDAGRTFDDYGLVRGRARSAPRIAIIGPEGTVSFVPSSVSPMAILQILSK
jgi:hypothetical protein